MQVIGFDDLYSEDTTTATAAILLFLDDFSDGYQSPVRAKLDKVQRFVSELPRGEEFPAKGGLAAASPFKKAGYLYVLLHEYNPFAGALPAEAFKDHDHDPDDLTVTTVAISLVQACLEGASYKVGGETCDLFKAIDFSTHFFNDLVEASRSITVDTHFRTYSLLFETLAYRANTSTGVPEKSADKACSYEGEFAGYTVKDLPIERHVW